MHIEAVTRYVTYIILVLGNVSSLEWVFQECKLNVTLGNRYI